MAITIYEPVYDEELDKVQMEAEEEAYRHQLMEEEWERSLSMIEEECE